MCVRVYRFEFLGFFLRHQYSEEKISNRIDSTVLSDLTVNVVSYRIVAYRIGSDQGAKIVIPAHVKAYENHCISVKLL